MIAELKPYPEYKESGLPWLGLVPGHWDVPRTKTLLREVDRRSASGAEALLSLRMQSGLVDHHALGGKRIPASVLVGYKHVLPGEMVMNRMRAAAGLFAVASSEGLVSPDYAIFRPVGSQLILAYAVLLFRTPALKSAFRLESRGLGTGESGFLRLYSDRFGMLRVPLPPPEEQTAIVRFLDWATGRLERAIRAKRKVIALLGEQKQAIIHRAVTRGLDPSVPLKPSGIPWLGDIPQHWKVVPLKFLSHRGQNGATPPTSEHQYYDDGSVPWFGPSSVGTASELGRPVRHLTEAAFADGKARLINGPAILVIVIGATSGKMGLLVEKGATNQQITAFELKQGSIVPAFAIQQLRSSESWLASTASTATIPILDSGIVNRLPVAFPSCDEQQAILSANALRTQPIISSISRLEREIELLREYRTRLVADVVTGKLDVREVAARLPDEAPLDSVEDDADLSDETEAADEESAV